jgi:hypothetical protein
VKIEMIKSPSGSLIPASEDAAEMLRKIKSGSYVSAEVKFARNYKFLKKAFSLFKLAFDVWDPGDTLEYKGAQVQKSFDGFRKDITILSGFYKATYNVRGEVRLEAESLSFASMSEDRFELVYKSVLNVVWKRVMRQAGYGSIEEVDRVVEELLRYE